MVKKTFELLHRRLARLINSLPFNDLPDRNANDFYIQPQGPVVHVPEQRIEIIGNRGVRVVFGHLLQKRGDSSRLLNPILLAGKAGTTPFFPPGSRLSLCSAMAWDIAAALIN
jgi:hypothetical protein